MPEPSARSRQIIAVAMMASAISMFVIAYVLYAGIVPLPEETRPLAAGVLAAAAFVDLLIGFWFFSKGQSS